MLYVFTHIHTHTRARVSTLYHFNADWSLQLRVPLYIIYILLYTTAQLRYESSSPVRLEIVIIYDLIILNNLTNKKSYSEIISNNIPTPSIQFTWIALNFK